jgi:xylitol oxidase
VTLTNWSGNHAFRARAVHAPSSLEELQEIVSTLPRVRVLGSRHSFTGIADSEELVTLERIASDIVVDREALTVTLGGAVRYDTLAQELERHGVALANLASLPHIAVAGAISTATHGSGERNGNLASSVAALEIATSGGEIVKVARGDRDFEGLVVGLGAVGAIVRITLDLLPSYEISQQVFTGLRWDRLLEHFDEVMASGYSVSVFSRWGAATEQVWVKRLSTEEPLDGQLFGAPAASVEMHPISGHDPVNCTPQLGRAGPWSERLPHFRIGFTPSSGAEIQSEYLVPRRHAQDAIEAVLRIGAELAPLLLVSELRTVAADRLWMSPQYAQDTLAVHFTWRPDQSAVERALVEVERALAPFGPRPHWGKLFVADAAAIAPRYERLGEFVALLDRLDPRGAFRNDWLTARLLGDGA